MGWKRVKQHYRISHIVHVSGGNICIGSVVDLERMVINPEGVIIRRPMRSDIEFDRFVREMDADPQSLVRLVTAEDEFDAQRTVTVYTFAGGRILEKQCEARGWPGVTHDGMLMYDHLFSTDKAVTVVRAKADARSAARAIQTDIDNTQLELRKLKSGLSNAEAYLAQLEADYPQEDWLHG
ncbi:hypothetical protein AB4Y45_34065 [Paraburkholderia sp. EG287A]|uniref:hypothetical protein n=1 Tax=Paraburkholderia sp. EG287A TaxID=3237012 RepID=UPI0034D28732